jgi:hypothetical protein
VRISPQPETQRCFPFTALVGCPDELAGSFQKVNPVRQTVDHECREHLLNIQSDIDALLHSGRKTYALCLQCLPKTNEM